MSLDEYVISQSTDELIAQLRQLGIKPLSDLSEEAQQLKHRIWERELSQGRKKHKVG